MGSSSIAKDLDNTLKLLKPVFFPIQENQWLLWLVYGELLFIFVFIFPFST
jgi:hypothetical protein